MLANNQNQNASTPAEKSVQTAITRLHRYYYDLSKQSDRDAWRDLQKKLLAEGVKCMEAWGNVEGPARLPDNASESVEDVVIDLSHVFNDQWNTVWSEPRGNCTGERVRDWYKFYEIRRYNVARGHWLELTDELKAARIQTVGCGYCGRQYSRDVGQLSFAPIMPNPEPTDGFCHSCLTSEYLKETELYLLKLLPMSEPFGTSRKNGLVPPELLAEYRTTAKRAKQHASILQKFQEKLDSVTKENGHAVTEKVGMLWLWEHNIDIDNVIYYDHTKTFSFGWRDRLSDSAKSHILDVISEFPYEYEFHKGN